MFKLFKNLGKKECIYILISIFFIVIQVLLDLKLPDYMSNITTLVQTNGKSYDIYIQGLYMLGCAFGSLLTSVVVGYLATYIASKFGELIRNKVYRKVLSFSMKEIKDFSVSAQCHKIYLKQNCSYTLPDMIHTPLLL